MFRNWAKNIVKTLFADIDISINGSNPWDLQIHHEEFYPTVLTYLDLGLGEAYMDGWFDCPMLDEFFYRIFNAKLEDKILTDKKMLLTIFLSKLWDYKNQIFNYQSRKRVFTAIEKHYDYGNDFFSLMLDSKMNYTCAYWRDAKNLEEAQTAKLKLACDKLYLKPGMRLLDIGCGWGGLAKFAAENYGVSVVGITISKKQAAFAQELGKDLPVEIRLQDYRDLNGQFDRIVSLGMFEHVGRKNYRTYMEVVHRCLKNEGLFLLQTIGIAKETSGNSRWLNKYIFPDSVLPSLMQINLACENLFVIDDLHNFGKDYDKTLMAWHRNFNNNWHKLKIKYGERFHRMWNYYLLSCAGLFRAKHTQLWQIVLSKYGVPTTYCSLR